MNVFLPAVHDDKASPRKHDDNLLAGKVLISVDFY